MHGLQIDPTILALKNKNTEKMSPTINVEIIHTNVKFN